MITGYAIVALIGLAVGSFLSMLSYRIVRPELLKIRRSLCPHCRKALSWRELLPLISFLVQAGRCRGCKARIPWRYPLIEIATAAVFVGLSWQVNGLTYTAGLEMPGGLILMGWLWLTASILIALFVVDLENYILPDSLTGFIFLAALIFFLAAYFLKEIGLMASVEQIIATSEPFFSPIFKNLSLSFWQSHLLGIVVGGGFMGSIWFLSQGRAMGLGDVKLASALGFLFGWPAVLSVIFWSFIAGAVVGVVMLSLKKKKLKSQIPFGPFLVGASLLFLIF